jgi:hypothetical protein
MLGSWSNPQYELEEYSGPETRHIFMDERGIIRVADSISELPMESFLSENRKVVIQIHRAYFHMITEVLSIATMEIEKAKLTGEKLEIILIGETLQIPKNSVIDPNHITSMLNHIIKQIELAGHSAVVSRFNGRAPIAINNFSISRTFHQPTLKNIKAVSQLMTVGIEVDEAKLATRKIYLTRKKTLSNSTFRATDEDYATLTIEEIRGKYQYKTNNRVDDELAVEKYFTELGFEIICPEDIEEYSDQIRLMKETRVVASLTSAGLTSMIYMEPGGVVIELITPITVKNELDEDFSSLHPHYYHLAFEQGLSYVNIPHDRTAEAIINQIETTPGLKEFLSA